jgi:hypothetical protein
MGDTDPDGWWSKRLGVPQDGRAKRDLTAVTYLHEVVGADPLLSVVDIRAVEGRNVPEGDSLHDS